MNVPSLVEKTLINYSFPRLLQMVQHGICTIDYIEKSIKWSPDEPVRDKIAFGITGYWSSAQGDLITGVFRDIGANPEKVQEILVILQDLQRNGYRQDNTLFHIGKELHTHRWVSELYIPYVHKLHKNAYGVAFEVETGACSHYEDMECHWLDALTTIRNHLKNAEYNALCHTLGHIPAGENPKHLKKSDPRYVYSIYFSIFLPYIEITNDLQELFYVFTKQKLATYLPLVEGYSIVSLIHISQEREKPPQCTIYFRRKDI